VKPLSKEARALLEEILATGDFEAFWCGDDSHPQWVTFDQLEDEGYVDWTDGPITQDIVNDPMMVEHHNDGPYDPFVTAFGRLALTCAYAAEKLS
jgi:hypothetical protein